MGRSKHPKKEVEDAIQYAEGQGWRSVPSEGSHSHVWGTLYCPLQRRDGCKVFVNSTPQNPGNHAKKIRKKVDDCPH